MGENPAWTAEQTAKRLRRALADMVGMVREGYSVAMKRSAALKAAESELARTAWLDAQRRD